MDNLNSVKIDRDERIRLLLDYIDLNPLPFNIAKHVAPGDFGMQIIYDGICNELVKLGKIEPCKNERGWFRPTQPVLDRMNIEEAVPEPADIWLPFELSDMVELYDGNIAIFAGAKSSGKTCIGLNVCRENEKKFDRVCYFNSEMGAAELRKRLEFFPRSIDMWETEFYSRYDDFHEVVQPGKMTLNVIDFLEIHDDFYRIGQAIKAIHDHLRDSLCVIFLQKNPGQETGLGGWRSVEVARLYVAMEKGVARVTDAKNWTNPKNNPNGLRRDFKIYQGTQISHQYPWMKEVE